MSAPPFPLPVLNTSRIMAELFDPSPTRECRGNVEGTHRGPERIREAYPATMRDTIL
jgi:hypothetical protein